MTANLTKTDAGYIYGECLIRRPTALESYGSTCAGWVVEQGGRAIAHRATLADAVTYAASHPAAEQAAEDAVARGRGRGPMTLRPHTAGQLGADLHNPDGSHRSTPPSADGRALELYESRLGR